MRKLNGGGNAQSTGKLTFIRPGALEEGQSIVGTFLRTIEAGQYDNNVAYVIRLTEGLSVNNVDITAGSEVAINSTGLLRKYMPSVPQGTAIKIVYRGKDKLKNGKTAHSFDLYADMPDELPAA